MSYTLDMSVSYVVYPRYVITLFLSSILPYVCLSASTTRLDVLMSILSPPTSLSSLISSRSHLPIFLRLSSIRHDHLSIITLFLSSILPYVCLSASTIRLDVLMSIFSYLFTLSSSYLPSSILFSSRSSHHSHVGTSSLIRSSFRLSSLS